MKKYLLQLILVLTSIAAFAQHDLTLTITSAGDNGKIYNRTPFKIHYVIKNAGTNAVNKDTIDMAFMLNGKFIDLPSLKSHSKYFAPGDSLVDSVDFTIVVFETGAAELCVIALVANDYDFDNNTDCVPMSFNWRTALAESFNNANEISVFPNPAADVINFTATDKEAAKVNITDLAGRFVHSVGFEFNQAQVKNLTEGVYLYQVFNNQNKPIKSGRIVISH